MFVISELYVYPVKSLGGFTVPEATLTDRGLEYDRRWMLIDEAGNFLTQREHNRMALLKTSILDNQLCIEHIHNKGMLKLPVKPGYTQTLMVNIWSDRCRAAHISREADEWFSDQLSFNCRLVYMPEKTRRYVDSRYARNREITSFSDGYPLLIIGQASLDDLNSRLEKPLPMNRFRPNIVFTGGRPFEEDNMKTFAVNGIVFSAVKPCARCVITTINQQTAEKGKEPLKTLSRYRNTRNNIYFGQNLLHSTTGLLRVGDVLMPV